MTPEPAAGQVLLRVAATSFNPVDVAIRAGYLRQTFAVRFPHVPGIDVAGVVAALGPDVEGITVGDPVIAFLPMNEDGATAEFTVAPADAVTRAPSMITLPDAAALPAVGLTAWQSLFDVVDLRAGQRILINGAGGGVGGFALQLAKHAGAYVIATASARSAARVRAMVDAGELRVNVTGHFPLTELGQVHDRGSAGEFSGKVIVTPTA